jgi:hypothetical protein
VCELAEAARHWIPRSGVNPPFTDADIYRIDVATGNAENLTAHQATIRYLGSSLFARRQNAAAKFRCARRLYARRLLDVATKKITWVTVGG